MAALLDAPVLLGFFSQGEGQVFLVGFLNDHSDVLDKLVVVDIGDKFIPDDVRLDVIFIQFQDA